MGHQERKRPEDDGYDTGARPGQRRPRWPSPAEHPPAAWPSRPVHVPAIAATYPLTLPFDLATETVRGFLGYFNLQLWQILDVFRPVDTLEPS